MREDLSENPAPELRLSPAEVEEMAAEFKVSPLWVRLALLFRPANRAALVAMVAWASGLPLPPT